VGLISQEDSSGGRQHFGRLTKQGNRPLRFLLVEAGQTASRSACLNKTRGRNHSACLFGRNV
jgi:transposase